MNKFVIKLLSVCAAALMVLSFAGSCSCDSQNASNSSAQSSQGSEENKKFKTLQEYADSDAVKSQIDSMSKAFKDQGYELKVYGEDNKFVFEYKSQKKVDADKTVDEIKANMEEQKATFSTVANALKNYVEVEDPVIKFVYLNSDGSEIYSTEIKSEN